jgi:creatinine amidohydrolase
VNPDFRPAPGRQAWMTTQAAREEGAARPRRGVLIPVGAVEQHGPHLPLGVDIWIATSVALAMAERSTRLLAAEPMPYGSSAHHRAFPGTMSLRPSTFIAVLVDVCTGLSQDGYLPIVLNGHGGNRAPMQVALTELGILGVRAAAITYFELIAEEAREILPDVETGTGHACALETSLMMHLVPDSVRAERIPEGGTPPGWPDPHLYAGAGPSVWRGFEEINSTGVIGRPSDASAAAGARLFEAAVERSLLAAHRLLDTYGSSPGAPPRSSP